MDLNSDRDILGQYQDHTVTPVSADRRMRWHHHTCPDGTKVRVLAQRIAVTNTVIHKWVVDGKYVGSNPARTPVDVPPSWVVIDAEYPATTGEAA